MSQPSTQHDGDTERNDGPQRRPVVAFFGRRNHSADPSSPSKSSPREELWVLIALVLFGSLIGIVVWTHLFSSH